MSTNAPLRQYPLLRASDLEEAREKLGRTFCPHRLRLGGPKNVEVTHNAAGLHRQLSLHYLEYGAAIEVDEAELSTTYVVQLPVAGFGAATIAGRTLDLCAGRASVLSPGRPFEMEYDGEFRQLMLRIDCSLLVRTLEDLLGEPVSQPLRFEPELAIEAGSGRTWTEAVYTLVAALDRGDRLIEHPAVAARTESLLATGLLLAGRHNHSELLRGEPRPVHPRGIQSAVEFLRAHAAEPLTTAQVARSVMMSVRSLQEGFRRYLGTTPMRYLREVRLREIHRELSAADSRRTTITEVAARWGLIHPGRFAVAYRERYGVSPSCTLRHGRGPEPFAARSATTSSAVPAEALPPLP
jgi:AraC-like DNA-binding protein